MAIKNIKQGFFKKFFNYLNDSEKNKMFGEILFYAVVWGSLINYSLWGIFGLQFKFYSFPSYGIFLYLIKSQVIKIVRNLLFKYENIGEEYR